MNKKSLAIGLCIYVALIIFAVINVGFRFDSNIIFYQKGIFLGEIANQNWTPGFNPNSYPVIIQNKNYYYPLDNNIPISELDGAVIKFSGKVIERVPPVLGRNYTQIYIDLTYIQTEDTLTILELFIIPIFLIIPITIFLLLELLGKR